MGPYPVSISSYRTLPPLDVGHSPLKRNRLSYSFGDEAKVDWGAFYPTCQNNGQLFISDIKLAY